MRARVVGWLVCGLLIVAGVALWRHDLDRAWLLFANRHAPGLESLWSSLSVLGLGLSGIVVALAADRGNGRATAGLLIAFPIGGALTHLPKIFLDSPRPLAALPGGELHAIGHPLYSHSSMPSGHALTAFAIATLVVLTGTHRRQSMAWLAFGIAAAIGWSRLAVAAHWPSDVLVGAALGLAAALAAWEASAALRLPPRLRSPNAQRVIALAEIGFAIGMLLYRTGYPDGWLMQAALAATAVLSAGFRWQRAAAPLTDGVIVEASRPVGAARHGVASAAERPAWQGALAGAVGIALLAWLLRHADFTALHRSLLALPPWAWFAAGAGLVGTYALRAWRLRLEWRRIGLASWAECMRIVLLHNAALAVLPLRGGEAGYLLLVQRRWGVTLAEAARSLLWLRLQDLAVLLVLALLLFVPLSWPVRGALAAAAVAAASFALPSMLRWGRRHSARVDRWATAVLRDRGDVAGWLLCIGNWLLKLLVVATLYTALAGIDAATAWRAALGGEWAGALPLQAPAGLGTYEAGVWAAARLPSAESARLVAAALAWHGLAVAVVVMVALASRVRRPRARDASTPLGAR